MLGFKRIFLLCVTALLAFQSHAFLSIFGGDSKEIKIAHYWPETHPHHVALEQFKANVEERTDGELTVSIFPNATLGTEKQMINSTRNGTVQAAIFGSLMQDLDYKLGFVEMPFLFRDYDHVQKFYDSEVSKDIEKTFEDYNVKHLANIILGFRVISSNKPIASPDDYKGVRLRIPNASTFVAMSNNLGVNAQTMAYTEVFTALEQGVVDAQENPLSSIKSQGFHEVQKYIVVTNHMFTSLNLGMNKDFYDSLTDEQKAIIDDESKKFGTLASELTIEENDSTLAYFKEQGLEVIEPSEEFYNWNVSAVAPIYEDTFKKYAWSKDYVDTIRGL